MGSRQILTLLVRDKDQDQNRNENQTHSLKREALLVCCWYVIIALVPVYLVSGPTPFPRKEYCVHFSLLSDILYLNDPPVLGGTRIIHHQSPYFVPCSNSSPSAGMVKVVCSSLAIC